MTESIKKHDEDVKTASVDKKKQRRNEIILIAVILILALGYFGYKKLRPAKSGAEVVVTVYGIEYARLPLDEDTELDISYLSNYNHLVIKDGVATVTEASCPDGLCIHQADISKSGEMIICLPNQVVVEVQDPSDSNGVDGTVR